MLVSRILRSGQLQVLILHFGSNKDCLSIQFAAEHFSFGSLSCPAQIRQRDKIAELQGSVILSSTSLCNTPAQRPDHKHGV